MKTIFSKNKSNDELQTFSDLYFHPSDDADDSNKRFFTVTGVNNASSEYKRFMQRFLICDVLKSMTVTKMGFLADGTFYINGFFNVTVRKEALCVVDKTQKIKYDNEEA